MVDRLPALPEDAVLVHAGPHKTGTSALQSVLHVTRDRLREHGVDLPGRRAGHHDAARALRRHGGGWAQDEDAPDEAVWQQLAQDVRRTPGRVLLSSEYFAQADAPARARLVEDLGAQRVHLLVGARDPAGFATSLWQQVLRQGRALSLDTWLEDHFRREEVPAEPEGFWSFADAGELVRRWSDALGPDRVTVVVLDPRDRDALARTVEQLLDLPDGLLTSVEPPDPNRGLTAPEAALLQRVLEILDSRLTWPEYSRTMRYGALMRLLRGRRPDPDEARTTLPRWALDQAATEAERTASALRASGVRVVGDLAALRPRPVAAEDRPPVTHVPLEAAAEALVGVVSAAVFGNADLERRPPPARRRPAARKRPAPRRVEDLSTRELARVLAGRVRGAARRRLRGR